MRRYKIVLQPPGDTTQISSSGSTSSVSTSKLLVFDSQLSGADNTAALDVVMDLTVGPMGLAMVGSYVEVFGLSISTVAAIRRWQGGIMSIYGGFSPGFQLTNPKQYGLLAKGYVLQAIGNWSGLHQSASFVLAPGGTDQQVVFYWEPGQTLSQAVASSLKQSYSGFSVATKLTTNPTATVEDCHVCANVYALCEYITTITNKMGLATSLGGIQASLDGTVLTLYDQPRVATPTAIDFNDFQGQPINFGYGGNSTVQTALNMRSDLTLGNLFTFPTAVSAGYVLTQPAAAAPLPKDNSVLTGKFMINMLRHVGRFRGSQGQDWVTIVNGVQYQS